MRRSTNRLTFLLLAIGLACGGDTAGPSTAHRLTGLWRMQLHTLIGGPVSCTFDDVQITFDQSGTSLGGTFVATGPGICGFQGQSYVGSISSGDVMHGEVRGDSVDFELELPALHHAGRITSDSTLSGVLDWDINLSGTPIGLVTLTGSWTARRLTSGAADTVVVLPAQVTLPQGDSVQLSATVRDGLGAPVPGAVVTWVSEDTTRATVSAGGLVRAFGKAGSPIIRVTAGRAVSRRTILVQQVPTAVVLSPDTILLHRGRSAQVAVAVRDRVGDPIVGTAFSLASLDPTIAQVTGSLTLSANGVTGTARVVATAGTLRDTSIVSVYVVAAQVSITPAQLRLSPSSSGQLGVQVRDSVGAPMAATPVWQSLDPAVVSVSFSGALTAGAAEGLAHVVATVASVADTIPVLIRDSLPTRVVTTQHVGGEPYGVSVSAKGVVYLTEKLGGQLFRATAPGYLFAPVLAPGGVILTVAFSPSGDTAFVARDASDAVLIVDVATDSVIGTFQAPGIPTALAVAPDGSRLFVGTASELRIRSLPALADLGAASPNHNVINLLTPHPTLPLVYMTEIGVYEVNVTTASVTRRFGTPTTSATFGGSVVSADGSRLYVRSSAGFLVEHDLATGQAVDSTLVPGFGMTQTADGRDLVLATYSGGVTIIDRNSLVVMQTYPLGPVYQVAVDPATGAIIASDLAGNVHVLQ